MEWNTKRSRTNTSSQRRINWTHLLLFTFFAVLLLAKIVPEAHVVQSNTCSIVVVCYFLCHIFTAFHFFSVFCVRSPTFGTCEREESYQENEKERENENQIELTNDIHQIYICLPSYLISTWLTFNKTQKQQQHQPPSIEKARTHQSKHWPNNQAQDYAIVNKDIWREREKKFRIVLLMPLWDQFKMHNHTKPI